jgi:hypothetical protein
LRYDRVLASAGSDFTTRFYFANPVLFIPFGFAIPIEDHDIELLSLTAFVEPMEHLLLRVEGNATKVNVENNSIADKTYYGVLAEAVYRF